MRARQQNGVRSTPQAFIPYRAQFGVAHRMPDVLVAEIGLDGPGVGAIVGKLVPTGMPQHVRMDLEAELCLVAQPLDHLLEAVHRDRCLALTHEQVRGRTHLPLQPTERPQFPAS